jgi:FecR protein
MKNSNFLKVGMFIIALMISPLALAKAVGTVTFKTGTATITHADKTVTQATKDAELNTGDTIETKEGRLQLALIDGGKVSLQPNTVYKINKYEFSGKEDGTEYAFTELLKGGLRTVSGLVGHKNRDRYQLKTKAATIGIRGTEFTANFDGNTLIMTTNHGSVDVCNDGGCLNATTGQSIVVSVGGAPKPSKKAAQAAAAAPGGKAVFSAGEQVAIVAPPVLPARGTVLSLAIPTGGGTVLNEIITGDIAYDENNNVTQISAPGKTINPLTFPATNSFDPFVTWGQSGSGTTYNSVSIDRLIYIAGVTANPANLANLTGTYNVAVGSSSPFLVSGARVSTLGLANKVTGIINFNFTALNLNYNINVPTTVNGTFNLAGTGALNPAGTFTTAGTVTNATVCTATSPCSGAFGTNLIQGAFFGANGERIGLQYGINTPSLNGQVYGNAVFR